MFDKKLFPHQLKALQEALACMNTLKNAGADVDDQAIGTIKAMLGIRETISDTMSQAIGSMYERERRTA